MAANGRPPWEITTNDVRSVISVTNQFQSSGQLSKGIAAVTRAVFDQNRISYFCPITPVEFPKLHRKMRAPKEIRKHLSERKGANKLPEEEAFWEIVRICWQETPISSFDHARFGMAKLMILCGIRVSEATTVPENCIKWIELKPSTISGEVPKQARTKCLALEYFASKKRSKRTDSIPLFRAVQHVPDMFKDTVLDTVTDFIKFSEPLRIRLKQQCETGRIFPEFDRDDILPILDFYTRLTGEPFLYKDPDEARLIQAWKDTYDHKVLEEIETRQKRLSSVDNIHNRVRTYFAGRLRIKRPDGSYERAPFLSASGQPYVKPRLDYKSLQFRVRDLEAFLVRRYVSKLSHLKPVKLQNGKLLYPYEFLFIAPKHAPAEERNGRICDIRKYAFIGVLNRQDLGMSLSGVSPSMPTLFKKYGKSEKTKALTTNSHSFRHLQNTELFKLGVSDAIITKRFNRNSIAQSHVYDHRNLVEDLKAIEIPEDAKSYLTGKSADTYRMISAGLATGPIVDEFREIQLKYGDTKAYKFLMAEADGLHTTPYGHCINSFTVDACPKHLECFSGSVHLTRSPLTEHTENLEKTRDRFEKLLASIDNHPAPLGAKKKMKAQAEARISGLDKMLATPIGEKVFPDGEDLSRPITKQFAGPFRDGKS